MRLFSMWGDSVAAGTFSPSPTSTERCYLDPIPTLRVHHATGGRWIGIDRSLPGVGLMQQRPGWWESLKSDAQSQVVVMRFGGCDALGEVDVDEFEETLWSAAHHPGMLGKAVILVGVIDMARRPEWQDPIGMTEEVFESKRDRADRFDHAVWRVAKGGGFPFVDVRALPFLPPFDIADAVHPAQAYSDRCADAIARALMGIS